MNWIELNWIMLLEREIMFVITGIKPTILYVSDLEIMHMYTLVGNFALFFLCSHNKYTKGFIILVQIFFFYQSLVGHFDRFSLRLIYFSSKVPLLHHKCFNTLFSTLNVHWLDSNVFIIHFLWKNKTALHSSWSNQAVCKYNWSKHVRSSFIISKGLRITFDKIQFTIKVHIMLWWLLFGEVNQPYDINLNLAQQPWKRQINELHVGQ